MKIGVAYSMSNTKEMFIDMDGDAMIGKSW